MQRHAVGPYPDAHLCTVACCAAQLQPRKGCWVLELRLRLHGQQHGMLTGRQPKVDALGPCRCSSCCCCCAKLLAPRSALLLLLVALRPLLLPCPAGPELIPTVLTEASCVS